MLLWSKKKLFGRGTAAQLLEKKFRGTAQEGQERQEGSFARTAYFHFRRFVDIPDTTRYVIVKRLQFEIQNRKNYFHL